MKELAKSAQSSFARSPGLRTRECNDPSGVAGTHVIYVLHDAKNPELYGGLPANPTIPWTVKLWKHPLKWLGNLAMVGGLVALQFITLRFGPKVVKEDEENPEAGRKAMSDEPVCPPERTHSPLFFHERMIHWVAAISYVYLMLTGLAFWSPWLFWIAVVLGGGTISRELHPWAGLIFVFSTVLMYRMWAVQMKEAPADKAWWQATQHYIRNEEPSRFRRPTALTPARRFSSGAFSGAVFCYFYPG